MKNLNKIFKSHLYNGKSNLLLSRELYLFKKSVSGKSENEGNTQSQNIRELFENTTEKQIIEDNEQIDNNEEKVIQDKCLTNKEEKKKRKPRGKAKVKPKLLDNEYSSTDLVINYKNISIPKYLLSVIKYNNKYNNIDLNDMEKSQQKDCFDFFNKYSKEEIVVILLLFSSNSSEMSFVKTIILQQETSRAELVNIYNNINKIKNSADIKDTYFDNISEREFNNKMNEILSENEKLE